MINTNEAFIALGGLFQENPQLIPWQLNPVCVEFVESEAELRGIRIRSNYKLSLDIKIVCKDDQGQLIALESSDVKNLVSEDNQVSVFFQSQWPVIGILIENAALEILSGQHIICEILCNNDEWNTVYESMAIQKNALQSAEHILDAFEDHKSVNLKFLKLVLDLKFKEAQSIVDRSPVLKNSRLGINNLLQSFRREMTSHGIKKTFRFWNDADKSNYLIETKKIIAILEAVSEDICLGFGAVLGKFRENDLIPHDDDIDILVSFPISDVKTIAEALAICKTHLIAAGYQIPKSFFSHHWVKIGPSLTVDVFVGLVEKDGAVGFYPSARNGLNSSHIFPPVMSDFYGCELPFPKAAKNYLEIVYGGDWINPKSDFRHPWDRKQYSDIAGTHADRITPTRGELYR